MVKHAKTVDLLRIDDLQKHPVWQYVNDDASDETLVQPITQIPVADLRQKIVCTQILLANGQRVWALIGNVDPTNARLTEHFLTLSVESDGLWFTLARYHDFEYAENGPEALAYFLRRSVDEVFPIGSTLTETLPR